MVTDATKIGYMLYRFKPIINFQYELTHHHNLFIGSLMKTCLMLIAVAK